MFKLLIVSIFLSTTEAKYPNLCEMCEMPGNCTHAGNRKNVQNVFNCLNETTSEGVETKPGADFVFTMHYIAKRRVDNSQRSYFYVCPNGDIRLASMGPCSWYNEPWHILVG